MNEFVIVLKCLCMQSNQCTDDTQLCISSWGTATRCRGWTFMWSHGSHQSRQIRGTRVWASTEYCDNPRIHFNWCVEPGNHTLSSSMRPRRQWTAHSHIGTSKNRPLPHRSILASHPEVHWWWNCMNGGLFQSFHPIRLFVKIVDHFSIDDAIIPRALPSRYHLSNYLTRLLLKMILQLSYPVSAYISFLS